MAKNTKSQTVELLHTYGSAITGEEWQWSAELVRGDDGRMLLLLVPTVDEGVEIDPPDPIAIDGGSDLFDRLDAAWCDTTDEPISEQDWRELCSRVAEFDEAMGAGLKARLREEYDEPRPEPLSEAEQWFRRARWPRAFNGRAVGYVGQEDICRIEAVRQFTKDHQSKTGDLPTGVYQVHTSNGTSFEVVFPETTTAPSAPSNHANGGIGGVHAERGIGAGQDRE